MKKNIEDYVKKYKRKCDGCINCGEGWLTSNIYDKFMFPGRPCHFVKSNGCSIYKNRPTEPCKNYKCEWLKDLEIPEWLKPSTSNVILTKRKIDSVEYLEVKEAGQKMNIEILNWLIMEQIRKKINIKYEISGGWNWIGSVEFCNLMIGKKI